MTGVIFQDTEDIAVLVAYTKTYQFSPVQVRGSGSRFVRVDIFGMEEDRFNVKMNLVPKAVTSKTWAPKFSKPNKSKGNDSMHGFTLGYKFLCWSAIFEDAGATWAIDFVHGSCKQLRWHLMQHS